MLTWQNPQNLFSLWFIHLIFNFAYNLGNFTLQGIHCAQRAKFPFSCFMHFSDDELAEEEDDGDEDSLEEEQFEEEAVEEAVAIEEAMGEDKMDQSIVDSEASFTAVEDRRENEEETVKGRKRGKSCYKSITF